MKFNSQGNRENLTVLLQQYRVDSSELIDLMNLYSSIGSMPTRAPIGYS